MTIQNPSFDDLVEQLRTESGKRIATMMALERGLSINPSYINNLIEHFNSRGAYELSLGLVDNINQVGEMLSSYDKSKRIQFESFKTKLMQYGTIDLDETGRKLDDLNREADFYVQKGEKADRERDINLANINYVKAMESFIIAVNYVGAFSLAVRKGLVKWEFIIKQDIELPDILSKVRNMGLYGTLGNDIYNVGIAVYEGIGEFYAAAELEEIKGDQKRAQMYQTLDTLLRAV